MQIEKAPRHKPELEQRLEIQALSLFLILLIPLFLLTGCDDQAPVAWPDAPEPAYWPTHGWQVSTPEQQGVDSERLIAMFQTIQKQEMNLHSILVVRNGYLVLEAYYDPYRASDRHPIESNTKSVIGMLVGIAIDQGKIAGVDQPMLDFFPNAPIKHLDPYKEAITLHNLLSMTPGLECEDFSPAARGMYGTSHWVQYVLDLPMNAKPGERWVYCSGAAHLLSAILEQATGVDARTYANRYLFRPLGIAEVLQGDWASDPEGVTNGITGLSLTPRDLAKLGYLYLHKGRWNGEQVVSKSWLEAATREQAYIGPDEYVAGLDRRFGYFFSIFPDQRMYGYLGMAGQELYVVPEENLVIVFTASLPLGEEDSLLALVQDYLVPAVQSAAELPANPDAQEELAAVVRKAAGNAVGDPMEPQPEEEP